ncbi:MAG: hypothetical protein JWP63_2136 [Candidatus Solibacter sp.]|nr:hypothetical protein [Candidatus Solibacter sp.]
MRLAIVLIFCVLPGFGQTGVCQSFFLTASQLARTPAGKLSMPTLQDAIGLTDAEMKALNEAAADYAAKSLVFSEDLGRLVFEARLRSIESGDASEWLAQRRKEIGDRADQAVVQRLRQLQDALGEVSFQKLERYVHSDWAQHCFVEPCGVGPTKK